MRTTVTLDPDVEQFVRRAMKERGLSFKRALNEAIRAAMSPAKTADGRSPTYAMGAPTVDLTKALQLAGELEDEELRRKLTIGK